MRVLRGIHTLMDGSSWTAGREHEATSHAAFALSRGINTLDNRRSICPCAGIHSLCMRGCTQIARCRRVPAHPYTPAAVLGCNRVGVTDAAFSSHQRGVRKLGIAWLDERMRAPRPANRPWRHRQMASSTAGGGGARECARGGRRQTATHADAVSEAVEEGGLLQLGSLRELSRPIVVAEP